MSQQKITGKNLHYDDSLPPFLARLRGQIPQHSDGPDPLLAKNRSYGKKRSGSAEAEDAPVVLDEDGNVLTGLKVGVDGSVQDTAPQAGDASEDQVPDAPDATKEAEKVAGIGGARKRKVGKVVGGGGGGDDDEEGSDAEAGSSAGKKASKGKDSSKPGIDGKEKREKASTKGKKAKKIKLSFGDDEEG